MVLVETLFRIPGRWWVWGLVAIGVWLSSVITWLVTREPVDLWVFGFLSGVMVFGGALSWLMRQALFRGYLQAGPRLITQIVREDEERDA
jgi:sensor histidine kinase regulating citrate/malate metabolism